MRRIERLLKHDLSFGGSGGFDQGAHWLRPSVSWGPIHPHEEPDTSNFEGMVSHALMANGAVSAVMLARQLTFSEVRFQYQRMSGGRPGELFGDRTLSLLESPWPNGTTGELLSRMDQDVSLAGNFFATMVGDSLDDLRIRRLRPDWVTILTTPQDSPHAVDGRPGAYFYTPGGVGSGNDPELITPERMVHYSPIPHPTQQWRGMSWLTPVVNEVLGHSAATQHKRKFYEHGTSSKLVVSYDANMTPDQFREMVEAYREANEGAGNAYKTIHIGHGADISSVGADLKQLDFKATQGAAETLIAANSGVGAIIAQLSEGLSGSSLNQGNFNAARRRYADMTIRPLWRMAAAALSKFAAVPDGARLWYDARDVAFLQEDARDAADIEAVKATTIRTLVDGGFDPASAVEAVETQDMTRLRHTGLTSVQLLPPGSDQSSAPEEGGP